MSWRRGRCKRLGSSLTESAKGDQRFPLLLCKGRRATRRQTLAPAGDATIVVGTRPVQVERPSRAGGPVLDH